VCVGNKEGKRDPCKELESSKKKKKGEPSSKKKQVSMSEREKYRERTLKRQ